MKAFTTWRVVLCPGRAPARPSEESLSEARGAVVCGFWVQRSVEWGGGWEGRREAAEQIGFRPRSWARDSSGSRPSPGCALPLLPCVLCCVCYILLPCVLCCVHALLLPRAFSAAPGCTRTCVTCYLRACEQLAMLPH